MRYLVLRCENLWYVKNSFPEKDKQMSKTFLRRVCIFPQGPFFKEKCQHIFCRVWNSPQLFSLGKDVFCKIVIFKSFTRSVNYFSLTLFWLFDVKSFPRSVNYLRLTFFWTFSCQTLPQKCKLYFCHFLLTFSCQTFPQKCKLFFLTLFLTFSCQTLPQKCKLFFWTIKSARSANFIMRGFNKSSTASKVMR